MPFAIARPWSPAPVRYPKPQAESSEVWGQVWMLNFTTESMNPSIRLFVGNFKLQT
jgi:hypothetical protein